MDYSSSWDWKAGVDHEEKKVETVIDKKMRAALG
jgi:hypothetical protein